MTCPDALGRWVREWQRPMLARVTAADRQPPRLVLNRSMGIVIGVALYLRHRGLSLMWARTRMESYV